MALVAVRESMRARAVAENILLERLPLDLARGGYDAAAAFDGKGQIGIVPVFTLGPDDLRLDALHSAWKVGWRYFWVHPAINVGAIMSIRPDGKKHPQLARYQWGKRAAEYANQLDRLVDQLKDAPGRQRLRILRLAPLQMEALWVTCREYERLIGLVPELQDHSFLNEAVLRYSRRERQLS